MALDEMQDVQFAIPREDHALVKRLAVLTGRSMAAEMRLAISKHIQRAKFAWPELVTTKGEGKR